MSHIVFFQVPQPLGNEDAEVYLGMEGRCHFVLVAVLVQVRVVDEIGHQAFLIIIVFLGQQVILWQKYGQSVLNPG